jgi:hypothetical protein
VSSGFHLGAPQPSPTSTSTSAMASATGSGGLVGPFTSSLSAYYWAQPRRISIDGDTALPPSISLSAITSTGSNNNASYTTAGATGNNNNDELSTLATPSSSSSSATTRRVSSQSGRLMVDKSRIRAKHLETNNNRAPEELMKGYLSRIFGSSSQRETFTSTDQSHIRSLLIDGKVYHLARSRCFSILYLIN